MDGSTVYFSPADLALHHKNPRTGDVDAIASSLKANDQYKPILVNRGTHTGRPDEVLAGNHTLKAIRNLAEKYPADPRWEQVTTWVIDVDDDRATRIVAADNRTSELGSFDNELLSEMLATLDDLEGTGYSDDDRDALAELTAALPDEDPDGSKLELWGDTDGEPDLLPESGTVWRFGHHTLAVMEVHTDWAEWQIYLEPGMLLYPYPSLLAPFTEKLEDTSALMVQPTPFMAGWLLTKWNRLMPGEQAVQVAHVNQAALVDL